MYRFEVKNQDIPMPGARRLWGKAYQEQNVVGFFLTISPVLIALSVEPTDEGKRLIAFFTYILGEPTLKYYDKREDYEDFTAEWFLVQDSKTVIRRVLQHLALGFKPEELFE